MAKKKTTTDAQIARSLDRIGAPVRDASDPEKIARELSPELRREFEECFPCGVGVNRNAATTLEALRLARVIGSRGPFAVDVEWLPLGRKVAAKLDLPKDTDDG